MRSSISLPSSSPSSFLCFISISHRHFSNCAKCIYNLLLQIQFLKGFLWQYSTPLSFIFLKVSLLEPLTCTSLCLGTVVRATLHLSSLLYLVFPIPMSFFFFFHLVLHFSGVQPPVASWKKVNETKNFWDLECLNMPLFFTHLIGSLLLKIFQLEIKFFLKFGRIAPRSSSFLCDCWENERYPESWSFVFLSENLRLSFCHWCSAVSQWWPLELINFYSLCWTHSGPFQSGIYDWTHSGPFQSGIYDFGKFFLNYFVDHHCFP